MKTTRVLALVVGLVALGAGCSSEQSDPKPSSSPSVSASVSPAAVTREQGAEQYLKLVEPFNEALEKCTKVMNPLLESGETTSSDFPKVREACKGMPEANRKFSEGLSQAKWPEEAEGSIKDLVDEVQADQLAWKGVSEVRTHEDLLDPKYPLTEDGPAAGLVRAHLGLPPVEDIEE
jgi:hypothetical protein